ncbi:hypothetical protein Ciccas_009435 [Cichlidogyrus casuarinus]|uniref:Cytochrome-b5 reductase n=1 Tax=Cichlidogyrus casuarinus TaxID=1844966 RepID=A0ABD2PX22_9PLAT
MYGIVYCFSGIGFWNQYMRTPEYAYKKPETVPISEAELSSHNTSEDMWIALNHDMTNGVYDVTEFAKYHPGGVETIQKYAGCDATVAFQQAHPYVSVNMIANLQKGILLRAPSSRRGGSSLLSPSTSSFTRNVSKPLLVWDWRQESADCVLLSVFSNCAVDKIEPRMNVQVVWNDSKLLIRCLLNQDRVHYLLLRLLPTLEPDLGSLLVNDCKFTPNTDESPLRLKLRVRQPSDNNLSTIGSVLKDTVTSTEPETAPLLCRLLHSSQLGDYVLLTLQWPDHCIVHCHLGSHVQVTVKDHSGQEKKRFYTIFHVPSLTSDPRELHLLVKKYKTGTVSSILGSLNEGASIEVSLPLGPRLDSFVLPRSPSNVVMLAAGSGITPMTAAVDFFLQRSRQKLIWFTRFLDECSQIESQLDRIATSTHE